MGLNDTVNRLTIVSETARQQKEAERRKKEEEKAMKKEIDMEFTLFLSATLEDLCTSKLTFLEKKAILTKNKGNVLRHFAIEYKNSHNKKILDKYYNELSLNFLKYLNQASKEFEIFNKLEEQKKKEEEARRKESESISIEQIASIHQAQIEFCKKIWGKNWNNNVQEKNTKKLTIFGYSL